MLAMISKWEVQEFQSVRVNDSLERHPCVRLKVQIDSFLLRVIFLCQGGFRFTSRLVRGCSILREDSFDVAIEIFVWSHRFGGGFDQFIVVV